MNRRTNSNQIVVIGGGLAGLTAATYLAQAGRSVTLFERSSRLGGRGASTEHDGFRFNMGAHAIYKGSPTMQALEELGIQVTGGTPTKVRVAVGDKLHLLPEGPSSLLRTTLLNAGEKWQLTRILAAMLAIKPVNYQHITVRDWLYRQTNSRRVRDLVEALGRTGTYTNAPDQLSLGSMLEQLRLAMKGVIYVDGGWQTVVDGLANAARKAGARVVEDCRVEEVTYSAGQVTGVRLADGTTYPAADVIVAAGPRDLSRLVGGGANHLISKWAEGMTPVRAACLDVALRRLPQPDNKVVICVDKPYFLTAQSEFSRVAPEGQALVYTLKYLAPSDHTDPHKVEQELDNWLDITQDGWREEVIERRYLPNMIVSNALVTAAGGGAAGRSKPAVPGIDGLYVAGDWVGSVGSLSNASMASARLAANLILARKSSHVSTQKAA